MKKKVISIVLGTAMAASVFAGCGSAAEDSTAGSASGSPAAADAGSGRVYLLNFKPEADEAWQELAKAYTDETGVKVNVLTAAAGQYATTLQSEMAKSEAPTIFNIGNSADAQTWDSYTLDLKDTDLYSHVSDHSLDIVHNGKVAGIANCYEAYGLIVNKTILDNYCTMDGAVIKSIEDIKDFDTLKKVADDIQQKKDAINEQFGYDLKGAFTSAGLDDGSSWRFSGHLANLPLYYEFVDDKLEDPTAGEPVIKGTYLDQFKNVWDLYVTDSGADPKTLAGGTYNAEQEFGMEQAVFYQNGDWEYAALKDEDGKNGYLTANDEMTMIPIYFGVDDENQGLCVGTENHWAINAKASEDDIKASEDFLNWVVTSETGRSSVNEKMGLSAPFDTFTDEFAPKNEFSACAKNYKKSVAWAFNATPNVDDWRKDVVAPLTAYTDGSGDWSAVTEAFVTGWADQWKLAHEDDTAEVKAES